MELTDPQIVLESWLKYFSWIYGPEGPEIPDQEIIDDQEALEEYIENWKKDLKNPKQQREGSQRFEIEH